MTEQLPENISALYPDTSVGDTAHQHHHDVIHQRVNNLPVDFNIDFTGLAAHEADSTAVHGIADTTQLLTTTVAGTTYAKKRVFDVKDYGAVGNGTTDDTAAIQACVTAACGGALVGSAPYPIRYAVGRVYFPAGAYKITAPILVYAVHGLTIEGSGRNQTSIRAFGVFKCLFNFNGVKDLTFKSMSMDGENQYSGTHFVDSAICLNWDPTLSSSSTSHNLFADLWICNLRYKWAIDVGSESANYDVSDCRFEHMKILGNRTNIGDVTTAMWQRGINIGSGVSGNVLNHIVDDVQIYYLRVGIYVNNVNMVGITGDCGGSFMYDFVYKLGPGVLAIRDVRVEESYHLVNSGSGAGYSSHLSVVNLVWSPGAASAVIDNSFMIWGYGGSVQVKNMYTSCLTTQQIALVGSYQIDVSIEGMASVGDWYVFLASGSTPAKLSVRGWRKLNSSLAIIASYGPIEAAYNFGDGARFLIGTPIATGVGGEDAAMMSLAVPGDSTTKSRGIEFKRGATAQWLFYQTGAATEFFLRDVTNSKMHMTLTPGAGSGGTTELNSALKVLGNAGFYGTTPVAKPTVTGSRGGNAALASLLTALASQGLIVDSSSA